MAGGDRKDVFNQLTGDLFGRLQKGINFDDIVRKTKEVELGFVSVAKSFGQGRENVLGIKQSLTDAVTEVTLLGGGFDTLLQTQIDFTDSIGRSVLLTKQSFAEIQAITSVTKLTTTELNEGFRNAGMSILQANNEMQSVVDVSRSLGVSIEKVSKNVVSNLGETSKFNFQNGVEGMARMAAQAVNLRIDMNQVLRTAESLFDPEKAIEMAAGLQRLGVQQSALLDPLRLMDLAQNDPEELQNQLAEMSKEFVRLNKSGRFEILPGAKRRLIEVERQLGMSSGSLSKMALASAELEDKMNKIKLPSNLYTEEQRNFIANMAQMGPGGEYMLKVDNKDLKLDQALELFTRDKDALDKFMKSSEKKTLEQLTQEQLDTDKLTNQYTKAILDTFKYGIAGAGTTEEVLDAQRIVTKQLPALFGGKEGKLDVESVRTKVDRDVEKFYERLSKGEVINAAAGGLADVMKGFGEQIASLVKNLPEFVKNISDNDNKVIMAAKGTMAGGAKLFEDLTGYDLGSKKILDENKRKLEERNSGTIPLSEANKGTTTSGYETKSSNVKVDYDGKIEVVFKPDYGMTEEDFKKFINKPEIQEQLRLQLQKLKLTGENPKTKE